MTRRRVALLLMVLVSHASLFAQTAPADSLDHAPHLEFARDAIGATSYKISGNTIRASFESNPLVALAGIVPGLLIGSMSGDPGANTGLQLRGSRFFRSKSPAIFVDGTPVFALGEIASAILNPESIESIEILPGAASSLLLSAQARSEGVILVHTRHGAPGGMHFTLRSTFHEDAPADYLPLQRSFGIGSGGVTPAGVVRTGSDLTCVTENCRPSPYTSWGPALSADITTYDHAREIFETGSTWDNTLGVSGGGKRATYYGALGGLTQNGFFVGSTDRFNRYTIDLAGNWDVRSNLTLRAHGAYARLRNGTPSDWQPTSGILLTSLRQSPEFNATRYLSDSGYHRSWRFPDPGAQCAATCSRGFDNPFYTLNESDTRDNSDHDYGGINAAWQPTHELRVEYAVGSAYHNDDFAFEPGDATTLTSRTLTHKSLLRVTDSNLNATATVRPANQIGGTITVGENTTWTSLRDSIGYDSGYSNSFSRRRIDGLYAMGSIDAWRHLSAEAGVRRETTAHENTDAWYPAASVAWRVHRLGRLRAAYGEAAASEFTGPPGLPAVVREWEAGADIAVPSGRAQLSITASRSNSTTPFFLTDVFNGAERRDAKIENAGWAVSGTYAVIRTARYGLQLGAQWSRNRSNVLSLGSSTNSLIPKATPQSCGAEARLPYCATDIGDTSSGISAYAQVGYPLGVWRGTDFQRTSDGALVIGMNGFPILDPQTRAIGNPEPDWTAGLSAQLTAGHAAVRVLVDHQQGGQVLNMTRASLYFYGTHADTELRGQTRTFGTDIMPGPVSGPGAGKPVVIGESWFSTSLATSRFVEDATHTRLRVVSVQYSIVGNWLRKVAGTRELEVSVAGRNPMLWAGYSGLDPVTSNSGAFDQERGIDWFGAPPQRRWIISMAARR